MRPLFPSRAGPRVRPVVFLALLSAALGALTAWGVAAAPRSSRPAEPLPPCYQFTEAGQRPTMDDVTACLEAHGGVWPPPSPLATGGAEAPVWDTDLLRSSCGAYSEWDLELKACARTAEPLPAELEWFEPLNRALVRPPEGVIVLHADGTWNEAAACPPELLEEEQQHVNNWRFCRDPDRRDRIPPLWNPSINGLPYDEAEVIYEAYKETLWALPGVTGSGLGLQSITIATEQPAVVPEAVEGIPIHTMPPMQAYRPSWLSPGDDAPGPSRAPIPIDTVTGLYSDGAGGEYQEILTPCGNLEVWDVVPTGAAFTALAQAYASAKTSGQLTKYGELFVELRGRYTAYEGESHSHGLFKITEFVRSSTAAADITACGSECEDIYGADSPTCLAQIDGQCGSTRNSCVPDGFFDDDVSPGTVDTATHYHWVCLGAYGGDNVECTALKPTSASPPGPP